MKVAVTAQTNELCARVDPRFGRAPWFVIIDTETRETELCDNREGVAAVDGAGIRAVQSIADHGVNAVATGNVGPNAFRALQAAHIDVYLVYVGTVEQIVERFEAGKLRLAEKPTRRGHW